MIREALEGGEGININGQNITNIRYADDTIILAESEQQLQHMIDKLDATCEQYGMAMNAKKTKTMIVEKTPEKQCEVNVKGQRLTQVKQYKYLGTTIEHTGQCKTEVAQRINQAKIAFWKKATILKSNISMKTRIRILMCYVFSVLSYGCETWTYSKAIDHKINAFEMWCYRRMLRISWTSHTTNIDVLQKIGVKETTMLNTLKNRKLSYAGHISCLMQKLLDISHTYGCNYDIEYNPSKSSIMYIDSRKAGNARSMTIGGKILNVVTAFSYLGHIICDDLSDEADLKAKSRQMYAKSNTLRNKFHMCSTAVKVKLFTAYFNNVYMCALWVNYRKTAFQQFKVAYNNSYRILNRLPMRCSASNMFANGNVNSCACVLRKSIYSLMTRIHASLNPIVNSIVRGDVYCTSALRIQWVSQLYNM